MTSVEALRPAPVMRGEAKRIGRSDEIGVRLLHDGSLVIT